MTEYSKPPVQGDRAGDDRYWRAHRELEQRTRFKYTVAPGCTVSARRGVLSQGDEIKPSDLDNDHQLLSNMITQHVVIRISDEDVLGRNPPPGWTHRVADGQSTHSTTRGVLGPGQPCTAADFAEAEIPAVAEAPSTLTLGGNVIPGRVARAGRKATDGKAALAELVTRGIVIERGKHEAA